MTYKTEELEARMQQMDIVMRTVIDKHGLRAGNSSLAQVYLVQAALEKLGATITPQQADLFRAACREVDTLYNLARRELKNEGNAIDAFSLEISKRNLDC